MNGLESTNEAESFAPPTLDSELLVLTAVVGLPVFGFWACNMGASRGKSRIHFFSSMREKKSDKRRSSADKVDFEPMIMSFFLALVNDTLILRQSRSNSPICIASISNRRHLGMLVTHAASIIRPNHRYDDAILVSSLTLVSCQNLDRLCVV